jgi:hypothetical protein
MAIRLTGAQVTRVREALARFEDNDSASTIGDEYHSPCRGGEGVHVPVEQLVEDILGIMGRMSMIEVLEASRGK